MGVIHGERPPRTVPAPNRSMPSGRALWWSLYAGVVAVLALGLLAGVNVSRLLVDPVTATGYADISPWIGALSNLGLMLWSAAAASCAVAAAVRHHAGDAAGARALGWTAALIAVLALDDAFLVHDHLVARITGFGWVELPILAAIGGATAAWWFLVGRRPPLWDRLQVVAASLFAVSLAIDLSPIDDGRVLRATEDVAKLLGIVTVVRLSAHWSMDSVRLLGRRAAAGHTAAPPRARSSRERYGSTQR